MRALKPQAMDENGKDSETGILQYEHSWLANLILVFKNWDHLSTLLN